MLLISLPLMFRSFLVTQPGPYQAISYQSPTFDDLECFISQHGKTVTRVDPDEFLTHQSGAQGSYINLTTKFPLRQKVSQHLDLLQALRFSVFVSCFVPDLDVIEPGCFFYPFVWIYPLTRIGRDVILHSGTGIAHRTVIGQGCFISGQVGIAGSVNIGEYCSLGFRSTISDNIMIANNTYITIGATVISDITKSNTVYKKHLR